VREAAMVADGLALGLVGLLIAAWLPDHQRVFTTTIYSSRV
jgi:hypothetical protein